MDLAEDFKVSVAEGEEKDRDRYPLLEKVRRSMSKFFFPQTEGKPEIKEDSDLCKNELESLEPKDTIGSEISNPAPQVFSEEGERCAVLQNSKCDHEQPHQPGKSSPGPTGEFQNGYTKGDEERCALLEKIKKLKKAAVSRPGVKEDLDILEKKLEGLESVASTSLLKAVQNVFNEGDKKVTTTGTRDNRRRKEDEICNIVGKINKVKKQLSEETVANPESGFGKELELLELKLKGLQLQLPRCTPQNSEPRSKGKISEVYSYKRFQSTETQTDSSLDAFWQISARESSVNDQIWYLLEKKTALDAREAAIKAKEEELKIRENGGFKPLLGAVRNKQANNIYVNTGTNGEFIPNGLLPNPHFQYASVQLGSSVSSKADDKSYKNSRYSSAYTTNKYKYKNPNYVNNSGSNGGRVEHKSIQK